MNFAHIRRSANQRLRAPVRHEVCGPRAGAAGWPSGARIGFCNCSAVIISRRPACEQPLSVPPVAPSQQAGCCTAARLPSRLEPTQGPFGTHRGAIATALRASRPPPLPLARPTCFPFPQLASIQMHLLQAGQPPATTREPHPTLPISWGWPAARGRRRQERRHPTPACGVRPLSRTQISPFTRLVRADRTPSRFILFLGSASS